MKTPQNIICPNCGQHNTWQPENPFRPFCSDRCKLIDLGEWANETRKIPGEILDPNLPADGNDEANDSGDHFF